MGLGSSVQLLPASVDRQTWGFQLAPPLATRPSASTVIDRTAWTVEPTLPDSVSGTMAAAPQLRPSCERHTTGTPACPGAERYPPATRTSPASATLSTAWRPSPPSVGASTCSQEVPSGENHTAPSRSPSTVREPTATNPSPTAATSLIDSCPVASSGPPGPPSTLSNVLPSLLNHSRGRTSPQALSPPATRTPVSLAATSNAHCSWSPPRASVPSTRVHSSPSWRQTAASDASPLPAQPTATGPSGVRASGRERLADVAAGRAHVACASTPGRRRRPRWRPPTWTTWGRTPSRRSSRRPCRRWAAACRRRS